MENEKRISFSHRQSGGDRRLRRQRRAKILDALPYARQRFGLRQSSGAFPRVADSHPMRKRQRTGAVQDLSVPPTPAGLSGLLRPRTGALRAALIDSLPRLLHFFNPICCQHVLRDAIARAVAVVAHTAELFFDAQSRGLAEIIRQLLQVDIFTI